MFKAQPVISLEGLSGAAVFNLRQFQAGPEVALGRIPSLPGIYAFFRDIVLEQSSSSAFFDSLCKEMHSEKFQARKGLISPLYEVSLRSRTEISKSKLAQIQELSESEEFKDVLNKALMFSILFQAPLYVGKSKNLRRRLGQHLSVNSVLSERLRNAGIEIARTTILILPTSLEQQGDANDIDMSNDDAANEDDSDQSLIFEEIFSRLFSPLFTIRYG